MKKLFLILAVLAVLVVVPSVSARLNPSTVDVHVVDHNGDALENVNVAPEWKSFIGGWNDFVPKDKNTESNGYANSHGWVTIRGTNLQVNYATLEGYTCTSGEDTRIVAQRGQNTLEVVCTKDNVEVPEFGTLAAIGLIAAAGLFIFIKRK